MLWQDISGRENVFGGKMFLAGKCFWRENVFGGKMFLAGKCFWREKADFC
jgi:hypothetical protein